MRKLLIVLAFLCLRGAAQNWCPAGAEWTYSYYTNYPSSYGYVKLSYINDTLMNSITYKKITSYFFGYNAAYGSNSVVLHQGNFYTYENNKVIYLNTDTLFNFKANIGDKWLRVPYGSSLCDAPRRIVTVLDTGHVTINGIFLKKLVLSYYCKAWESSSPTPPTFNYTDTVFEKIGSIKKHLIPAHCETQSPIPDASGSLWIGDFRCYSDNNFFTYHVPNSPPCYYITDIQTHTLSKNGIGIYPNPGTDILYINGINSVLNTNSVIRLHNIIGQTFECKADDKINISHLPKGIYFLQLYNNGRLITTEKIIKE